MKSMRMVAAVLVSVAFEAAAFGHTASDSGLQRLIVLLQPGSAPLPDITALGGSVEFQLADRMIVTVPAGAVAAISSNPRVKFVQRSGAPATVRAESLPVVPATGSGQWSTGAYVYDGAGNISAIGTGSEPNSDLKTNSFAYDKVGRLVQGSANYASGNRSEIYAYDPFGNMTTRTPFGQTPIPMQVDPATNRRAVATYDANGNEKTDTAITATRRFDVLNMMTYKHTGAVEEYYVYTPDDQRIGVLDTVANTWTWSLRDEGGALLRQYASSETARTADWLWIEDYVYADGRLLAAERMASQGGRRHFHLDHLGTPRLITGPTGTLIARHDYLPFGEEVTPPDNERLAGFDRVEPMQFTGQEGDSSGSPAAMLDYMHARSYRPYSGRFLSVDPADRNPQKPQTWNSYSYALNSPIKYIDPSGETVDLRELSPEEQNKLFSGLHQFTGNEYGADENGNLTLISVGTNSSSIATDFLNGAIASKTNFLVVSVSTPTQWNRDEQRVEINFHKLDTAQYGHVDANTFNLGSSLVHELIHGYTGLEDLHPDGTSHIAEYGWTGPVVDYENDMRAQRGLPLRESYVAETGRHNTTSLRFNHVDPQRPDKVFRITGLQP